MQNSKNVSYFIVMGYVWSSSQISSQLFKIKMQGIYNKGKFKNNSLNLDR